MRIVAAGLGMFVVLAGGVFAVGHAVYAKRSDAAWALALGGRLPAARVGSMSIPYRSFVAGRAAVAKSQGQQPPDEWQMVLLPMMRARAVELIGTERGFAVTEEEEYREFEGLAQATSGTADGAEGYVQEQFGLTREQFEAAVIRPLLFEQKIAETLPGATDAERVLAAQDLVEKRLQEKDVKVYLKF